MFDSRLTTAQRAILIDAHASLQYGGLSQAGDAWVPDHPEILHEHRGGDVAALGRAGLLHIFGHPPVRSAHISDAGLLELDMITDQDRLQIAVDLLQRTHSSNRLAVLRTMVLNSGGRADLPHASGKHVYTPVLCSVELHGVTAFASDAAELPENWLKAAQNTLRGFYEEELDDHVN